MTIQDRLRNSRPEDLSPHFLDEVADLIDQLQEDIIIINDENGEEVARVTGRLATYVLSEGASRVIHDALRSALEAWEDENRHT